MVSSQSANQPESLQLSVSGTRVNKRLIHPLIAMFMQLIGGQLALWGYGLLWNAVSSLAVSARIVVLLLVYEYSRRIFGE